MKAKDERKFSNKAVSHLLRSIEAAYLIKNVNRFRTIAYQNAADTVEKMTREIKDIWQEGNLDKVPGIGQTIAGALDEYFKKGRSKHFEKALAGIPPTVFELMKVPSIGPKKAYKLTQEFNLTNPKTVFKDLKKLCEENKIAKLENFGTKSQKAILKSLEIYEKRAQIKERMPLPYADRLAKEVLEYMKNNKKVKRADALGSLRREVATIGDIDIAVAAKNKDAHEIVDYFLKYPKKVSVDNAGLKKASIVISPDIRIDLRVQDEENYGPMLQYFTGSKNHNIRLREYAQKKDLSISEYGIKDVKKRKTLKFKTEEDFYKFLGFQYIPPELREGTNELEVALQGKIPKLVELKDIKGDLHLHSNYNIKPSHDFGENSYSEIYDKAKNLRYRFVGFSDHNPKISDLSQEQIISIMKKRKEHIDKEMSKKNASLDYFIGLETDILPNGKVALPDKALEYVDYIIVSVHSVFSMGIKEMTERVLKALDFPKVKILGHPTGRLLGRREGYEMDWPKIFEKCKKKNIALEINSWPERLDLVDTLVFEGLKYGVKYVVSTDAHAVYQMDNMFYGVSVARRGWATKNDIINTLEKDKFKKWLRG